MDDLLLGGTNMVTKRKFNDPKKQRRERRGYFFGDININEFYNQVKDIENKNDDDFTTFILALVTSMIAALHMCQIRQSLPNLSAQNVEKLESYRQIKRKYTLTSPIITGFLQLLLQQLKLAHLQMLKHSMI
jgi:hypothetical protein